MSECKYLIGPLFEGVPMSSNKKYSMFLNRFFGGVRGQLKLSGCESGMQFCDVVNRGCGCL